MHGDDWLVKRNKQEKNLKLGTNVIEMLLPHRRPLLMVDYVEAYGTEPEPWLRAGRSISANEPVFAGHFPDLHIWPGIYTQEGLGQTANLLAVIRSMVGSWEARGGTADDVLDALRNEERGFKLHPGYDSSLAERLRENLPAVRRIVGMSGSVNLKFLRPVFGGQRLEYWVSLTREHGDMMRFSVEATVDGQPVAQGVMTGFVGQVRSRGGVP